MKQYSIKDIAKLCNVSTATVSRVINNNGRFSEKTRQRVLDVIKQTGYKIDNNARSLRTNITFTIGILVPDIKNPFFADLVQKIEELLFFENYSTIICNTDKNEKKEKAYLRMLENKKVDGIIVISGSYQHGFKFQSSLKEIPYICIDREPENFHNTVFISSNHYQGALDATNYLFQKGAESPVVVVKKVSSSVKSRIDGFKESLKNHSLKFVKSRHELKLQSQSSFAKFLQKNHKTDSLFAVDDGIAIELLKYLKNLGYQVPQQIQVVGFDDVPAANLVTPKLTTIQQNTRKIAQTAVTSMMHAINKQNEKGSQFLIPTKLIIRETTK